MTYAVKMKCLACSLHFQIYTWREYWHEEMHDKAFCPECGTQGSMLTFIPQELEGEIFSYVPGAASPFSLS